MNIGFIGCGNMGTAMAKGILRSKKCEREELMISCRSAASREKKAKELMVRTGNNCEVARFAGLLFLAVKPQLYAEVIAEIRSEIAETAIVVSIAPGRTLDWLAEQFGRERKLVRMMPNTPAMVQAGMAGVCANGAVTEEELAMVRGICGGFSETEVVPESLMDVVTAVSGSSPAYVFLFIEAMADAAVAGGMPRAQAYRFAANAVLGSAKLVAETGLHPGELKDMVCSPAGTTIQAVRVLEEKGFRSSVFEAVMKCLEISRGM